MENVNVVAAGRSADFRSLMAGFPSGVAVVTAVGVDGRPLGLTCSSLSAVSAEPPLLLVCIDNRSRTLVAIEDRGHFAVNLLHQYGQEAAKTFSVGAPDRFCSVRWSRTDEVGLPRLDEDARAIAECRVHSTQRAGDHTVVIGEVQLVEDLTAAAPLLYGLRAYAVWPGGSDDTKKEDVRHDAVRDE